jgi:hypothetical protein
MYVNVTSANDHQTVLDFATVLFNTYVTHFVNERQADTDVFTYIFAVEKMRKLIRDRGSIYIHIRGAASKL